LPPKSGSGIFRRAGAFCAGLFLFLLLSPAALAAEPLQQRRIGEALFVFPPKLAQAARNLGELYPELIRELRASLGWGYDRTPTVVLLADRGQFEEWAGTPFFSAFAVPDRELIVLDHHRLADPVALRATFKHEICHLLLGRHIDRDRLPRWLNEGVAQWSSDGLSELLAGQENVSLPAAAASGRLFRLSALAEGFPHTRWGLALAYAQSRSVVDYLVREYGRRGLLDLLEALKAGDAPGEAVRTALGISPAQLESDWRESLETTPAWLLFLAQYLYELLFAAAALSTVYGFIRLRLRHRRYTDGEDEED
jgi:hypothetical protein